MKTIVLIPAYNASKTIRRVIEQIPREIVQEVIVVDDGSNDNTYEILKSIPHITVLKHETNKGYGSAQITLYKAALEQPHDYTVILHADGGHTPSEIPLFLAPLMDGKAEVVVGSRTKGILEQASPLIGSRFLGATLNGAMPAYKFLSNVSLTSFQNLLLGTHYHSFHDGFRGCTRQVLEEINWNLFSNWYLFDMEFLVYAHRLAKKIVEIPVSSFYDPNAGSNVPNIRYGLRVVGFTLKQLTKRFSKSPL